MQKTLPIKVYGSGPASAAFALSLILDAPQSPISLELLSDVGPGHESSRFRPWKISGLLAQRLRRLLLQSGVAADFLTEGPEIEKWGMPSGPRYGFIWDIRAKGREPEKFISEARLLSALEQACRNVGVAVQKVSVFSVPNWSADELLVVEAAPSTVGHWGAGVLQERLSPADRVRVDWAQFRFPNAAGALESSEAWIGLEEQTLIFVESHPEGGIVVSLMGPSRLVVERTALRLRRGQVGRGKQLWQSLWILNPSARVSYGHTWVGSSGVHLGPAFGLGRMFGQYPEACNTQGQDSLWQAFRLHEAYVDFNKNHPLSNQTDRWAFASRWSRQERKRFEAHCSRAWTWEKLLRQQSLHPYVLSLTTLMPSTWRQSLKTPL